MTIHYVYYVCGLTSTNVPSNCQQLLPTFDLRTSIQIDSPTRSTRKRPKNLQEHQFETETSGHQRILLKGQLLSPTDQGTSLKHTSQTRPVWDCHVGLPQKKDPQKPPPHPELETAVRPMSRVHLWGPTRNFTGHWLKGTCGTFEPVESRRCERARASDSRKRLESSVFRAIHGHGGLFIKSLFLTT